MVMPPDDAQPSAEALGLWRDLCEKDDRTSPEEYPDMALITQDEFCSTLDRSRAAGVREERARIAAHIDCSEQCRYASAGICRRTDELCHHHVAESIRVGKTP